MSKRSRSVVYDSSTNQEIAKAGGVVGIVPGMEKLAKVTVMAF